MNICTVTVTYDNRAHLVERIVRSISSHSSICMIVIVDNGSDLKSRRILNKIALEYKNIKLIRIKANRGSAFGFGAGIRFAFKSNKCNFIWLLDDDNLPEENALDILISKWNEIGPEDNNRTALCSLRSDRPQYDRIARKGAIIEDFAQRNGFLNFHIFDIGKKIRYRVFGRKTSAEYKKQVVIPYAPYGGLFLPINLINYIGLPNRELYLYADDTEYTYRITKSGGRIILIPGSKIVDIDFSWNLQGKYTNNFAAYLEGDIKRVYYTIRNRVYFEKNKYVKNKVIYFINMFIYFICFCVYAVLKKKYKKTAVLLNAVKNGMMLGIEEEEICLD